MGGLEVIMDDICCDDLDKAVEGVRVPRAEDSEKPAIVRAELQIGFLRQIVEQGGGWLAPISRCSEHNHRN